MAADEKQVSAMIKRQEQLKRWKDSDTNSEPVLPKRSKNTVQFQDGCVFLAACSSGDKAEVEKLLRNVRSADINTANVDGLTALHQACIDDNVEMVEFLVENGAYINICDNEGWTPLHATSSCGFLDIARYLINHNANVAAVNNDGDLPFDIAENVDMQNFLQQEMDRKGIDAEAARYSEEQRMLEDANLWLSDKKVKEVKHPKTGASALHVAASKGYMKVMKLLLEAGVDINAEDNDGWTPLHAAAHWGKKEACQILVNNMCDMGHKNKAGHTAFDLAENGMMELLEELKEKQPSLRKDEGKTTDIILPTSGYREKRSSSVTRMSADQKQNILHHASEMEHITTLPSLHPKKTEDNRTGNTETDHRNDTIKPPLPRSQLQERLAQSRLSNTDPTGTSTSTTRSTLSTTTSTTASTTRTTDGDAKLADRNTSPFGQTYGGYRSSFSGRTNYVPYYLQRQQREAQAAAGSLGHTSDDTSAPSVPGLSHDRGGSVSRANSVTSGGYSSTLTPASVTTTTTTTTTTTGSTNSVFKRSYEPPKRDEETETQRKARAKHARQTRRSTQGVSLEDIEKAEESIHRDKNSSSLPTTTSQSLSLRSTREATSVGNGVVASTASTTTASTVGIPTASTTTTVSSIARASDPGGHSDDKSISSGYKRWTSDDKSDSTDSYNIRGSYRRSRIERDSTSSTSAADVTTSYVPRSQRMAALTATDTVTTTTAQPIPSLLLTSASTQDESSTQEKKDEKKESTSLRARRQRRERRSTGIGLDGEGGETGGQTKTEDDDPDDNIGSAVQDGLSSNSDHLSQRSKSVIEVTKSVGQIEIDYKKKFDEEKLENERLKKELNVAKRGLEEVKSELDRASRQRDTARNNERDKKILEKKLAEMEEELKKVESLKADNQRLKDENGALIRVIGKLSK